MRFLSLTLSILLALFAVLGSISASHAAPPDPQGKNAQLTLKVSPPQQTVRAPHRWSKKRKIITAVVVGCVVATAIAVPVACGVHRTQEVRHQDRMRRLAESLVSDQETTLSRQEQQIESLLSQGPTLSAPQRSILQADLAQIKQQEGTLNQAFIDLVTHKPIGLAAALDNNAVAEGNSGFGNSGNGNVGSMNAGLGNLGFGNTGTGNVGFFNSGQINTGIFNTGNGNTGFVATP